MNVFVLYFSILLIFWKNYNKIVSSTILKSKNFKSFCHKNLSFNDDNVLLENVESNGFNVKRTLKGILENSEQVYKPEEDIITDKHKTFLENKYMNIATKTKTFQSKIFNGIKNKLEEDTFSDNLENTSLNLETSSGKIKIKEEYTFLNQNLSLSTEENINETNFKTELESFPTIPIDTFEISSYNLTNVERICFCDLTLNHCDINCCCDVDCSPSHWKVFTKCNDYSSDEDLNYCLKTNLMFENNTKVTKKHFNNGLFCILSKNIKSEISKTKKEHITSLKTFNKILPKKFFSFLHKTFLKVNFKTINYKVDSYIWVFEYKAITPFGIQKSTLGLFCSDKIYIKYLRDKKTMCSIQHSKNVDKCIDNLKTIFYYLKNLSVIANPHLLNDSKNLNYEKICGHKVCIKVDIYICLPFKNCVIFSDKEIDFSLFKCSLVPLKIFYQVLHNGSEGIKEFKAYIWFDDAFKFSNINFIQTTEVKFMWVNSSSSIFKRSGNPGYLIGKPLLSGKKININLSNDTIGRKSIIELSADSQNSLGIFGSKNGICSLEKRIPINFKENGYYSCLLKLTKENFNKEKCIELQNLIFQLLLGKDVANITKDNFFNKFVASFGNSRPENTEVWVQVLIDLFPLVSSQISFKSGYSYFICSNMICDLTINVAYSSVGSFLNPQSQIMGVSFQFGTHKDILFHCDTPNCENNNMDKNILLTTTVHFFDLTEPAQPAFADRLSLEIKLPHDFFYPFFSRSSIFQLNKIIVLIFFVFALCFKFNY